MIFGRPVPSADLAKKKKTHVIMHTIVSFFYFILNLIVYSFFTIVQAL